MSGALLENPTSIEIPQVGDRAELARFKQQDAVIAELALQYMPLRITGLSDKEGYKRVREARMVVRTKRTDVEKTRKLLKEDALEYGRAVDAEAKRLTALIEPIEAHLQREESAIDAEKERLRKAAEDAKRALVQRRLDALVALGATPNPVAVADMTEEQFTAALAEANAEAERRAKAEAERLRIEAEEREKRQAEEARLKAERERLAEIERQQKAEADRLKAESDRIAAAEAEQRRQAELAKATKEAVEKVRVETEQRLAAEAKKAEQEAETARLAKLQAEKEKPLRAKIEAIADTLAQIVVPAGKTGAKVDAILTAAVVEIRKLAKGRLS